MNFQQLQDDVLVRLGEAQASLVAAYMPATNATTPVTGYSNAQVIGGWINDGQNDLARNYYPVSDLATYSWPAGQQFAKYAQFVCTSNVNNVAFGVRRVNFGGKSLVSSGRAAAENWNPNMDTDPLGVPDYYFEDGVEGIGVYPVPAVTATVTMRVIVTPAPLVNPTDTPAFPADRHVLLSWYAAAMCLLRNTEDPVLQSRGGAMMNLYREQARNILSRVWRLDADFANDLMADRPEGPSVVQAGPNPQ